MCWDACDVRYTHLRLRRGGRDAEIEDRGRREGKIAGLEIAAGVAGGGGRRGLEGERGRRDRELDRRERRDLLLGPALVLIDGVTASVVDARMECGGRRRRRRRRLCSRRCGRWYDLMRAGELGRLVLVLVLVLMVMVMLVLVVVVLVLVLVLMLMLVMMLVVLLLLKMMMSRAGYALQSCREVDRGRLVELLPLLLPPIGDAGTTRRGIHRFAGSSRASSSFSSSASSSSPAVSGLRLQGAAARPRSRYELRSHSMTAPTIGPYRSRELPPLTLLFPSLSLFPFFFPLFSVSLLPPSAKARNGLTVFRPLWRPSRYGLRFYSEIATQRISTLKADSFYTGSRLAADQRTRNTSFTECAVDRNVNLHRAELIRKRAGAFPSHRVIDDV